MSKPPPPVVPRKPSGVRVMLTPGEDLPPGALPVFIVPDKEKVEESNHTAQMDPEREVEILNHCFDDVERFMTRLQQTAEAQSVLNQRKKKKRSRKSKKSDQDEDLLTMKACPPSEEEFVNIFQKIKYSLSLLDILKTSISQPDAPELLHHVFVPLQLMVNTTGGPELGESVVSPALTAGAVSLLDEHLTPEEKELWTSLGPNWTLPGSQLSVSVPPYSPVFLDGWQPQACDPSGRLLEDPVESQHKQDALRERTTAQQTLHAPALQTAEEGKDEVEGNFLPPDGERLYCCSYDFVARNSSELSVLQGETLEVIESSKRWWKCRNRFDQIGFLPFNILEPLSALNNTGGNSPVVRRESKKTPLAPPTKYYSYAPPSPDGTSPTVSSPLRPQSMVLPSTAMQGEDSDRVLIMNDELLQRLAGRKESVRPLVIPRSADTSTPLNYHSPASEVEAWLNAKGFSQQTVKSLGILSGAQLFSLNKDELRIVSPEEGARVYSQITVQKALLEDVRKATELETVMEKQKLKADLKS